MTGSVWDGGSLVSAACGLSAAGGREIQVGLE